MADGKKAQKIIAQNKKAWHDYFVEEKYEAGVVLTGTEIKSTIKYGLEEFSGMVVDSVNVHVVGVEL